ncbi:cilia- and flagella-associated protein 45 [Leptinotarsa decemlineata]|uniref:cilia- and flagella-associated protein 45 n=1 Tax=Leptinotarsa decemlineata TaxID=7539 RepID=UPI003D3067E8
MPLTGKFHSRAKQAKITGQHNPQQCNHSLNGTLIHYIPKKATEGKEMIKTIDAEGSRDLIVPNRYPIDRPAILGTSEFQRLKKQAHVVTLKDRVEMIEEAERQKNQLQMESMMRKDNLLKAQKEQKAAPGSKLETVESEAAKKNLYLLRRSKELMIEQDDRVKVANGVILAAKCRAIRNAQIAEKKLIEKQLQEENKRLDMMMEQQRQKLIQIEAQKRELDDKKKQRYVVEVKQQIKENEIGQLLEAEKIEEESRMLNKALIALQKDEEEKMQKKKETQMKMREEFRRANDEAKHYKTLREEEQRISDMRIQEFMRQKAEREEAREKEMVISRATKEKEIARLRAQQEKSRDYQAIMDELNALRSQEEKEREWRENEKVAAKKKLEIISDLRAARAKQIEDIRKAQAVSLARDEEDFMKVAKVQRELFEKDLEEQKKKKEQIAQHRKELLKQINEKERERINWQQEKFEDGKAQRLEFEVKDRNVEDYLKLKMEKLKEHNLPEQYISDIERQLKLKK